jgi:uncharacterized protein (DUF1800 family)
MGNETLKRKDFFKKLLAKDTHEEEILLVSNEPSDNDGNDPLFEKYSRKTIGNRFYSQTMVQPDENGSLGLRPPTLTAGLAPYTGPWTEDEALHFVRRTTYGAKKSLVDTIVPMGMSAAVDSMLVANMNASTQPSQFPLVWYNFTEGGYTYGDLPGVTQGMTWVNNYLFGSYENEGLTGLRVSSNNSWSAGLMLADDTIREKMTQFWYHFIPINSDDMIEARNNMGTCTNAGIMCYNFMNILRANATGNFINMIKAVTKSPGMMIYLGNQFSTAAVPNENFARELLELFMMGKTPVQNYTESDIVAASKILSGWRVENFNFGGSSPVPFNVHFDPTYHNQDNKTFSAFFGNTTIPNQTGANGANELDIFFNMLLQHQGVTIAKYVCRRLYRYFVYYDIDANVETNIITPLANALVNNNWEILPVLKLLFKSQHFFDMANRGVMIKSPFDVLYGTIRTFKMSVAPTSDPDICKLQYQKWAWLDSKIKTDLNQGMMCVPNVSGWKAFYQAPSYYQNWINSGTIQKRQELLFNISTYRYAYITNVLFGIDHIDFVKQFPNTTIQYPDTLIDAVVKYMFPQGLSATYKANLKLQTLLSNQVGDYYWTDAWNNYTSAPTNMSYENIVRERLKSMITTLILLAEYQLM